MGKKGQQIRGQQILLLNYSMKFSLIILILFNITFSYLVKPINGQELNHIHILFEWEQQPDVNLYNLQVSGDSFFDNIIIDIIQSETVYIEKEFINWNNNYYWRICPIYNNQTNRDCTESSQFFIRQNILVNLDVEIYNDSLIQDGLVMYNSVNGPFKGSGVIDKFGNEIWSSDKFKVNHINDVGQIYGMDAISGQGIQFNYDENILWSTPEGLPLDGHEIKQLPNGNYMSFVWDVYELGPIPLGDWTDDFQSLGYIADGITEEILWLGLRLVEWDQETKEEVWSWNPFDYFTIQDHDLYGGIWWEAYFEGFFDWVHSNAFHFDDEGFIYVSHRHLSRITKIDYITGDIIWNMGLPQEYNTGDNNICTDLRFSFQHNIQLLNDGSFLFFDNGNISHFVNEDEYPTTRIRRIRVLDNSFCETLWEYELPQNLYGSAGGSVQLLDNGNYSIYTFGDGGNDGRCNLLEITPDKQIIWKVSTGTNESVWYRSYKIPSIHPNAFSVLAKNYEYIINEQDTISAIKLDSESLKFFITNHSGYDHSYKYILRDIDENLYEEIESELNIPAYQSQIISFESNEIEHGSTNIILSIWPKQHIYARKDLDFLVFLDAIIGDVNGDGGNNILDIILIINMILGNSAIDIIGDINEDEFINILDIIDLVNIILDT